MDYRKYPMNYRKYTWVGNRISADDMACLHLLKETERKPITSMIAEAVKKYLEEKHEILLSVQAKSIKS